jgi:hypothetical protein
MKAGQAFLRIEGEEFLQQLGRFGAGPGEGGVDRTEDRRQGFGLVQLEQPAADVSAAVADGEQMEELLVLLHRSICGE